MPAERAGDDPQGRFRAPGLRHRLGLARRRLAHRVGAHARSEDARPAAREHEDHRRAAARLLHRRRAHEPAHRRLRHRRATTSVSVSHLSAAFGLPEMCAELIELLSRAGVRTCVAAVLRAVQRAGRRAAGRAGRRAARHSICSRVMRASPRSRPSGARMRQLAARAWREFTDGRAGYGPQPGIHVEAHRGAGGVESRWMKVRAFPPTPARNGDWRASCAWRTRATDLARDVRIAALLLLRWPAAAGAAPTEMLPLSGMGEAGEAPVYWDFRLDAGPRRRRVETHRRAFLLGAAGLRRLLLRHQGRGKPDDDPVIPKETGTYRRSFELPRPGAAATIHIVFEAAMTDTTVHHQRPARRRHAPGRLLSLQLRHHAAGEARPQRHRSARREGIGQQERESRRAPRRLLDLWRHLSAGVARGAAARITSTGRPSTRAPTAASPRRCILERRRAQRTRALSAQLFDAARQAASGAASRSAAIAGDPAVVTGKLASAGAVDRRNAESVCGEVLAAARQERRCTSSSSASAFARSKSGRAMACISTAARSCSRASTVTASVRTPAAR